MHSYPEKSPDHPPENLLLRPLQGLLPSETYREPEPALTARASPPVDVRPWVCLSCQMGVLVAEQVQVSTLAQVQPMLWLRPLLLRLHGTVFVWNMSQSADLVWPAADCYPAYAEDVLPWLAEQQYDDPDRHLLNQFLQSLWREKHPLP